MPKDTKPTLVDLVAKASESDLAQIDEQIAAKEIELADATTRIGGELEALKALRRVVDVKLHGKPQRKKREKAPKPSNGQPVVADVNNPALKLFDRIAAVVRENGPGFPAMIARKLDVMEGQVAVSVSRARNLKLLGDGRVALADHEERD